MKMENRPQARTRGLVVRELPEETLVYDLERHRAHCLGSLAAVLWRGCDGVRSTAELCREVRRATGTALDEPMVRATLHRLSKARLLVDPIALPNEPSRREWLRRAAAIAGLSVATLVVPTALQAATCTPSAQCASLLNSQCTGLPCCEAPTLRCARPGGGQFCTCR